MNAENFHPGQVYVIQFETTEWLFRFDRYEGPKIRTKEFIDLTDNRYDNVGGYLGDIYPTPKLVRVATDTEIAHLEACKAKERYVSAPESIQQSYQIF